MPLAPTPTPTLDQALAAWQLCVSRGLPFAFRGHGLSMWPTLRPGDEAHFAPFPAAPALGDIVLARHADRLLAHRLVAVDGDRFLLRGDAMPAADPPLPRAALLGQLVSVRRGAHTLPANAGALRLAATFFPLLHRRAPRLHRLAALTVQRAAASVKRHGNWR